MRNKRYRETNAERIRERTRAWRVANPAKVLEYGRRHNAKNPQKPQTRQRLQRYGITQEGYEQMLAAQDHACAICEAPTWQHQKRLHVDHDHATGAVRGLLCSTCNMALGGFRDSPELLGRALQYLTQAGTTPSQ